MKPRSPTVTAINSASEAAANAERQPATPDDYRFQLSNRLQSSLDLYEVLSHFFHMMQTPVRCNGIGFRNPKKNIQFSLGSSHTHSASYTLQIAHSFLGELTLHRDAPFTEHELLDIEMLLGLLVLPLRNALLYRDALEHSLRDPLTGIGNRSALDGALNREIRLAKRADAPLSVVIADIDFFKRVNDTAGHTTGDLLIKRAAQTIAATIRQTDQVFRFGGEEYVVILGATAHREALQVAERIRCATAAIRVAAKTGPLALTMSLGVSTLRPKDTKTSLFERADQALLRAKGAGRDTVMSGEDECVTPAEGR